MTISDEDVRWPTDAIRFARLLPARALRGRERQRRELATQASEHHQALIARADRIIEVSAAVPFDERPRRLRPVSAKER
jgi:hypothetical protein